MKKEFKSLRPTKRKPTDDKIDDVLREISSETPVKKSTPTTRKQKLIPFNVKLPQNLYDALDEEAKNTGLSKKAVVVSALWEKLGKQNK
jgi:hypothetical protein